MGQVSAPRRLAQPGTPWALVTHRSREGTRAGSIGVVTAPVGASRPLRRPATGLAGAP